MSARPTRRQFLQTAAAGGAVLGMAGGPLLPALRTAQGADAGPDPKAVHLPDEIEPLVRLLEETPRQRLIEQVGARVRGGLSYHDLLAALLLAAVRNVQPRPSVGFKFHAVLVVNSVHLASLASPEDERWLPIFWALDYFKDSQARDVREGNWTMGPVDEAAVPPADKARAAFVAAMEGWDEAAADAAVAALARSAGTEDIFDLLYRFGARDYRSIGHKAIFVSNSRRVLESIGRRYAEPVLRSLAYALLMHEDGNPAQRDDEADRSWRRNGELAPKIGPGWLAGKPSAEATTDLLAALREGSDEDAAGKVVELLGAGIAPQSIWDAVFCGAGELLMRQPGIVSLHSMTTTNALYYAFQTTGDDLTRRMLLLQNASFLPLFRKSMGGRGRVGQVRIDRLEPQPPAARGAEVAREVFADVDRDRMTAARKVLGYLDAKGQPDELIDAGRKILCLKGDDPHDYKFGSAALEDGYHVSPGWRGRYLAASMMHLCGSGQHDNPLVQRTRDALKS